MKRLLLALLLLAAPARAARIAVVNHITWNSTAADQAEVNYREARKFAFFTNALNAAGVNYAVIDECGTSVLDCRNGIFPSTAAKADTFAAVIHWNFQGYARSGNCTSAWFDSLTLVAAYPKVPQLMLFTNGLCAASGTPGWIDHATKGSTFGPDTTGCNRPTQCGTPGMTPRSMGTGASQCLEGMYQPGYPEAWIGSSYVGNLEFNPTPPAGTITNLLSYSLNSLMKNACASGVNSWNADSSAHSAASETTVVWERSLKSLFSDAAPIIFAWYQGGSELSDSTNNALTNNGQSPCETEWPTLMVALARLDHNTNGGVFGKQVALSLTIDGGAARCGRRNPWGMYAPDSSTVYGVIDSCASRHIPAVLATKADSAATYASEMNHWRRWSELRFTPWYDFNSAASAAQSALGLKAARTQLAASFPVSGTAIPLMDDWSPSNLPPPDSVLAAVATAGFRALRIDGQKPRRYFASAIGYGADVAEEGRRSGVTLIAHGGNSLSGGALQWVVASDSILPYTPGYVSSTNSPIGYEQARWWAGLLSPSFNDYDFCQYDQYAVATNPDIPWMDGVDRSFADRFYGLSRRAHAIRLGVNDLGGDPNGPPPRWGWWAIKSMDNAMRIINRTAGRTVIKWAYPEDIQP